MARLFQSGFELNASAAGLEWSNKQGTVTTVSSPVRSGGFAMRSLETGVNSLEQQFFTSGAEGDGPYWARVYIRIAAAPTAPQGILYIGNRFGQMNAQLELQTDRSLKLYSRSGAIGSASSALALNTWYRIELYAFVNTVSGKFETTGRIDGVDFASTTTSTDNNGSSFVRVGFQGGSAGAGDVYFDDFALNDNTGSFENSWPGEGSIIHVKANATGDANGFGTRVGGSGGATNNFNRSNENTPDDATSYVASGTLNDEDLYNFTNPSINTYDVVKVVAVGFRFANITAADATTAIKLEIEKAASGTKTQSGAVIPNSTSWATHASAAPRLYALTTYQDPDGATWTSTTLNSMQAGFKITAANVRSIAVTALWISIEYRAGAQTTKTQSGVSRIRATATKTQTGKGNIRATTSRTQTGKGAVRKTTTRTQTGLSRMVTRATKTQTGISRVTGRTSRTQTGKGNIRNTSSQTITGKSRLIRDGIVVYIDGVERNPSIIFNSFEKTDILNQQVDTCSFRIRKYGNKTFTPEVGSEVIIEDDSEKIFGGVIINIDEEVEGHNVLLYTVKCKDYSQYLDRMLVIDRYNNSTVEDVIAQIIDTYAPDFTYENVACDIEVESVSFDRVPVSEALDKLARMTNFSWYVDYDYDIHFFEKNTEEAPFNLTDTSANYIFESLKISRDFSQMRNRVFVRGGEVEGEERTETFDGDGVKKIFPLSNKFSELPDVTVGGSPVTVGVDFLDEEADFDCFWSFNEKYIRFKDTTVPSGGADDVAVTGIPLYPIIVRAQDPISIAQYGVYEYAKTEKSIKSTDEATRFAIAEMEAYSYQITEGSFQTYTRGLRSGQVITLTSTMRDIEEQYIIQRVKYKMRTPTEGIWTVELATLKSLGMIQFLIDLLRRSDSSIQESESQVLNLAEFESEEITIIENAVASTTHNPQSETITIGEGNDVRALDYPVEFVLGPQLPSGFKRQFILDGSPLA